MGVKSKFITLRNHADGSYLGLEVRRSLLIRAAARWGIALAVIFAGYGQLYGCRYSVRDIGFVDLSSSPYRFFICVDRTVSERKLQMLRETAAVTLDDANVEFQIFNVDDDGGHPVAAFLAKKNIQRRPTGILVSPGGKMLHVPIGPRSDEKGLRQAIETIVTSPTRRQIFSQLFAAHSVVLLVEGTDPEPNRHARQIADDAIRQIANSLNTLPKPIEEPPKLVIVSPDEAKHERVLLWSLGIERHPAAEANLVVLFGRGRPLTEPLIVPGTTQAELTHWLDYVGQDCECDLDRALMQGIMVPHRWKMEDETRAVKHLKFDPGNPIIQAEVRRILARGPTSERRGLGIGLPPTNNLLDRIEQIEVGPAAAAVFDSLAKAPASSSDRNEARSETPLRTLNSSTGSSQATMSSSQALSRSISQQLEDNPDSTDAAWLGWGVWATMGLIVAVSLLAGSLVLLRFGRKE